MYIAAPLSPGPFENWLSGPSPPLPSLSPSSTVSSSARSPLLLSPLNVASASRGTAVCRFSVRRARAGRFRFSSRSGARTFCNGTRPKTGSVPFPLTLGATDQGHAAAAFVAELAPARLRYTTNREKRISTPRILEESPTLRPLCTIGRGRA